ncbi:MAG: LysM peptidoglycan-binding domain-containing protein [Nitrospira sp.]|nr:LysM peptidoglycan-binding domain-containing protein [Nitrospira sp.]
MIRPVFKRTLPIALLWCIGLVGNVPAGAEPLSGNAQATAQDQQAAQTSSTGDRPQGTESGAAGEQAQPEQIQGTEPRPAVETSAQAEEALIQNQPPPLAETRNPDEESQERIQSASAPGAAGHVPDETSYNIPIIRDQKVEGHMRFFHTTIRDRFEQWLVRLDHYKPLVERIFSQFDLPSDLVYLSLVESGFNPHARSRARATGPWQFMKGTAKRYGLRVDKYVDERKDPNKSTVAAAYYLRDLYDQFGTWPLAMAAYNAGEGKVQRALDKTNAESFWDIAKTKHLRRETKEYVPRIMAATIIAKNPDQYGFSQTSSDVHQFEEVVVDRPLLLRDIAKTAGVPFEELRRLNPELLKDVTPPDDEDYHLKVPVGMKETVEQKLELIPAWKPSAQTVRAPLRPRESGSQPGGWYRVRSGDKLSTIAKRFRLSVQELKQRNHLTGSRIRPGDLLSVGPK